MRLLSALLLLAPCFSSGCGCKVTAYDVIRQNAGLIQLPYTLVHTLLVVEYADDQLEYGLFVCPSSIICAEW